MQDLCAVTVLKVCVNIFVYRKDPGCSGNRGDSQGTRFQGTE